MIVIIPDVVFVCSVGVTVSRAEPMILSRFLIELSFIKFDSIQVLFIS